MTSITSDPVFLAACAMESQAEEKALAWAKSHFSAGKTVRVRKGAGIINAEILEVGIAPTKRPLAIQLRVRNPANGKEYAISLDSMVEEETEPGGDE